MFKKREGGDTYDTGKMIYIVYDNPSKSLFGSARINPASDSILTEVGLFHKKKCDTLRLRELSRFSFEDDSSSTDPNKDIIESWFYTKIKEVLRSLVFEKNSSRRSQIQKWRNLLKAKIFSPAHFVQVFYIY